MDTKLFQTLKFDVDFQAFATKYNVTVFEYKLSNDELGHCLIADLQPTNGWLLPTGEIVNVVKLERTFEPETSGHHEVVRIFKGRGANRVANDLAQAICQMWVNTHFMIDVKESRKFGKLVRLSITNLTDEQLNNFHKSFPITF